MIKSQTIFVLGAGASMPYGYPSGSELLDEIIRQDDLEGRIMKALYPDIDFDYEGIKDDFKNKLKYAYPSSIDYFIKQYEEHKAFVRYGKAAIMSRILTAEMNNKDELNLPRNSEVNAAKQYREQCKWYGFFFNNILRGNDYKDFRDNNIRIVNFNYDRSFECFAYRHLKYTYNQTDQEIYKFFRRIHYRHVYGCIAPIFRIREGRKVKYYSDFDVDIIDENVLSSLNFVFNSGEAWNYGEIKHETIYFWIKEKKNLDNIKVINEERGNCLQHAIILGTQNLCFLGFGYDDSNIELLNINAFENNCKVTGTVLGISLAVLSNLKTYFAKLSHDEYSKIGKEHIKEEDILSFLKHRFVV